MTITLPIPDHAASPNGRGHWRKKAKLTKRLRSLALVTTLKALDGQPPPCPVGYSLAYYWPARQRDDDNAIASAKAYLDGICQGLRIDDKTLRFRDLFHHADRRQPRLEIHLHLATS